MIKGPTRQPMTRIGDDDAYTAFAAAQGTKLQGSNIQGEKNTFTRKLFGVTAVTEWRWYGHYSEKNDLSPGNAPLGVLGTLLRSCLRSFAFDVAQKLVDAALVDTPGRGTWSNWCSSFTGSLTN